MSSKPGRPSYLEDFTDQADRDSERGNARFYGLKGEEYAAERFGLDRYETGHSDLVIPYDHRFSNRSPPAGPDQGRYPGQRRKVQVKGARLRIKAKHSGGGRAGRFRLWDEDHEKLVEDDALYLFLGYDPDDADPVKCVRWVEAADLADVVDGLTWYDCGHGTKSGRPTDINARSVFPDA